VSCDAAKGKPTASDPAVHAHLALNFPNPIIQIYDFHLRQDCSKMAQTLGCVAPPDIGGVAMSEHLGAQGIPHVVLERRRIAERWRF
jgi:hypothetical protein